MPFAVGERMDYSIGLGILGNIGKGVIEISSVDSVHGFATYRLRMTVNGGIPGARVNDVYESWLDVEKLISRRFQKDVHEVRYNSKRSYEIFPEERRWQRTDKDESGLLPTDEPLDDLSFLYFVRTLPLTVGETYTLHRYFREDGNPVTLKVVRKEVVKVPAGTYNTIVVQPIIRTRGLFGEGGKAEVFFSDDDLRIPVQITSRVPVIGSLRMRLKDYHAPKAVTASGG